MKTVVVVGGGISGLASAWRVREEIRERGTDARIIVFEREAVPGGHARTDSVDGFTCEWGPNGFLDNEPRTLELVDGIGLRPKLMRSDDLSRRRFILKDARLQPLPESPPAFLKSSLLSPAAKLRIAAELWQPARRDGTDETVGAFGRRRLGSAFTATFLDPMVSGIFAGDIERLSLPAAFPRIADLERQYGGLFRGMIALGKERKQKAREEGGPARKASAAGPGGVLHSFDGGLRTLITQLAGELGDSVRTGVAVRGIHPSPDGGFDVAWESEAAGTRVAETLRADALVVATPGYAATDLMAAWDQAAARALADIPVAPVSVVCLGYERSQVGHPLDGFGGVFPRSEGLRTLGVIFTSSIFTGRARDGHVLLRIMIGGARDPEVADLTPDETIAAVRDELDPLLGIKSAPSFSRVYQHRLGIPQYELGHLDRVATVDALEKRHPGLYFTGNSLRGIAMNSCVKDAWRVGAGVADAVSAAAPDRVAP